MKLTSELKQTIESWDLNKLLEINEKTPVGDALLQGESGSYIATRTADLLYPAET
jgi:hypothetical protein